MFWILHSRGQQKVVLMPQRIVQTSKRPNSAIHPLAHIRRAKGQLATRFMFMLHLERCYSLDCVTPIAETGITAITYLEFHLKPG